MYNAGIMQFSCFYEFMFKFYSIENGKEIDFWFCFLPLFCHFRFFFPEW